MKMMAANNSEAENAYDKCKTHYYYSACVHHVHRTVQPEDIRRSKFHRRLRTPDFVQITLAFHLDFCTPTTCEESRCHISFRLARSDSLRSLLPQCQKFTAAAFSQGAMKWRWLHALLFSFDKKDGLHFKEQKELHFSHMTTTRYTLELQHSYVLISHSSHKATLVFFLPPPAHYNLLSISNSTAVWVIALQSLLLLNYKLES